jgi:hypothetical protein
MALALCLALPACPTPGGDGPRDPVLFVPDGGGTADAGGPLDAGGGSAATSSSSSSSSLAAQSSSAASSSAATTSAASSASSSSSSASVATSSSSSGGVGCLDCFQVTAPFPVTLPLPPAAQGALAAGDVTGDGALDWVVALDSAAHDQSAVAVVSRDGATTQLKQSTGGVAPSGPVLLDVNADLVPDVVFADFQSTVKVETFAGMPVGVAVFPMTLGPAAPGQGLATWNASGIGPVLNLSVRGTVHRLGVNGQPVDGWPNELGQQAFPDGVAVCQLNADQAMELALVAQVGGQIRVLAVDGVGALLPGFPSSVMVAGSSLAPTCVDVDGDNVDEVAVMEDLGTLHLLDANGLERAGFPRVLNGGGPSSQVSAGDLTGDGKPELVVAVRNGAALGNLWAVGADGAVLTGFPVAVDAPVPGAVLLADVNGDARNELIAVSLLANLYVVDGTGAVLSGYPRSVGGNPVGAPALMDMNGDGRWELAVASQTRLLVGSLKPNSVNRQHAPWVRFRGHDGRTNRYRGEAAP